MNHKEAATNTLKYKTAVCPVFQRRVLRTITKINHYVKVLDSQLQASFMKPLSLKPRLKKSVKNVGCNSDKRFLKDICLSTPNVWFFRTENDSFLSDADVRIYEHLHQSTNCDLDNEKSFTENLIRKQSSEDRSEDSIIEKLTPSKSVLSEDNLLYKRSETCILDRSDDDVSKICSSTQCAMYRTINTQTSCEYESKENNCQYSCYSIRICEATQTPSATSTKKKDDNKINKTCTKKYENNKIVNLLYNADKKPKEKCECNCKKGIVEHHDDNKLKSIQQVISLLSPTHSSLGELYDKYDNIACCKNKKDCSTSVSDNELYNFLDTSVPLLNDEVLKVNDDDKKTDYSKTLVELINKTMYLSAKNMETAFAERRNCVCLDEINAIVENTATIVANYAINAYPSTILKNLITSINCEKIGNDQLIAIKNNDALKKNKDCGCKKKDRESTIVKQKKSPSLNNIYNNNHYLLKNVISEIINLVEISIETVYSNITEEIGDHAYVSNAINKDYNNGNNMIKDLIDEIDAIMYQNNVDIKEITHDINKNEEIDINTKTIEESTSKEQIDCLKIVLEIVDNAISIGENNITNNCSSLVKDVVETSINESVIKDKNMCLSIATEIATVAALTGALKEDKLCDNLVTKNVNESAANVRCFCLDVVKQLGDNAVRICVKNAESICSNVVQDILNSSTRLGAKIDEIISSDDVQEIEEQAGVISIKKQTDDIVPLQTPPKELQEVFIKTMVNFAKSFEKCFIKTTINNFIGLKNKKMCPNISQVTVDDDVTNVLCSFIVNDSVNKSVSVVDDKVEEEDKLVPMDKSGDYKMCKKIIKHLVSRATLISSKRDKACCTNNSKRIIRRASHIGQKLCESICSDLVESTVYNSSVMSRFTNSAKEMNHIAINTDPYYVKRKRYVSFEIDKNKPSTEIVINNAKERIAVRNYNKNKDICNDVVINVIDKAIDVNERNKVCVSLVKDVINDVYVNDDIKNNVLCSGGVKDIVKQTNYICARADVEYCSDIVQEIVDKSSTDTETNTDTDNSIECKVRQIIATTVTNAIKKICPAFNTTCPYRQKEPPPTKKPSKNEPQSCQCSRACPSSKKTDSSTEEVELRHFHYTDSKGSFKCDSVNQQKSCVHNIEKKINLPNNKFGYLAGTLLFISLERDADVKQQVIEPEISIDDVSV